MTDQLKPYPTPAMDAKDEQFVQNVSKSRYGSSAKMYGRVTIDGKTFVYHKPTDTLVRADIYRSYKESLK